MSNVIDKIIDSKAAYAYAFMTNTTYGYGHMTVNIRPPVPETGYRRDAGLIAITCQIGSDGGGDMCEKTYAWSWGFAAERESARVAELERAIKMMKKIQRYLDKVERELGYPETYAEFCQRILVGSGVGALVAEPSGWVNGGMMRDKELLQPGAASMRKFKDMEAALIGRFSRKAA